MPKKVYQRVALRITRSMRSTPTKVVFTLLNWLLVDITTRQIAVCSSIRLNAAYNYVSYDYGNAMILNDSFVPARRTLTPRDLFSVPGMQHTINMSLSEPIPSVYTDGSKKESRVCGGFYIENLDIKRRKTLL